MQLSSFSADAYLLQLQKYELPPAPVVQPQSHVQMKQPVSLPSSSATPSKKPLATSTPSPVKNQVKVSLVPTSSTTPRSSPMASPVLMQKTPVKSPIPSPKPGAQSPLAMAAAAALAAVGTKGTPLAQQKQSPAPSPVPAQAKVLTTAHKATTSATATMATSSTPPTAATVVKMTTQAQAVIQGQAGTTVTAQGLALIRTPVQLPPGVQATMITNSQGVPVMRLEGPGLQGSTPVTLVTSPAGGTQFQGATILRVGAQGSVAASSGVMTGAGTIVRLPMQITGSGSQGAATLVNIPVSSAVQMPSGNAMALATPSVSGAQTVIRPQLSGTVSANLPLGTQFKVLGAQGQLTAVGPGGIPLQIVQNIKPQQLASGAQIAQVVRAGTPAVVHLTTSTSPIKTTQTIATPVTTLPQTKASTPPTQITPVKAKQAVSTPTASLVASTSTPSPVSGTQSPGVKLLTAGSVPLVQQSSAQVKATAGSIQSQVSKTVASATIQSTPQVSSTGAIAALLAKGQVSAAQSLATAVAKVVTPHSSTAATVISPSTAVTTAQVRQVVASTAPIRIHSAMAPGLASTQAIKPVSVAATILSPNPKALGTALFSVAQTVLQAPVGQKALITSAASLLPSSNRVTTSAMTPVVSAVTKPIMSAMAPTTTPVAVVSPLMSRTATAAPQPSVRAVGSVLPTLVSAASPVNTTQTAGFAQPVNGTVAGKVIKAPISTTGQKVWSLSFNLLTSYLFFNLLSLLNSVNVWLFLQPLVLPLSLQSHHPSFSLYVQS